MAPTSKAALFSIALGLAACSDGARTNVIEGEASALVSTISDPDVAWTFAQVGMPGGLASTLLVTAVRGDVIEAVDLTPFGAPPDAEAFDVLALVGDVGLRKALAAPSALYRVGQLLPAAGGARRHVATGTNFREHAREAEVSTVFNFPKFGPATPARTQVAARAGALLDYEVELCVRFDRDVRSLADFDAARKGFFLCGDFTDRARLLRLVDPRNVASGRGFSDAKSAPDFFPSGALLVVPSDWRTFVKSERMVTEVNREKRQDARGAGMMLDFRAVVERALTNVGGGSYSHRGVPVPLVDRGTITRGSAVMSGTSAGVIFMPPRLGDYALGVGRYIFTGPMVRGESPQRDLIEAFIRKEMRSGRYLQPGDVVTHRSSTMGDIVVRVEPAPATLTATEADDRTRPPSPTR